VLAMTATAAVILYVSATLLHVSAGALYTSECKNIAIVFVNPPTVIDSDNYTFTDNPGNIINVDPERKTVFRVSNPPLSKKEDVSGEKVPNQITDQYVSRFQEGKLITELVIREGAGYATTFREKEEADRRLKENFLKLRESLFSEYKDAI